jgi:GTP-binding protein Era
MSHKAGYINILGKPNVGKSTLMNALLGEKLSIVSAKAQTTRHRIIGLANGSDYQMIFSDTPGILDPKYKLHEKMMDFVSESLEDADVILLVVEAGDSLKDSDTETRYGKVIRMLETLSTPVLLLINKCDKLSSEKITEVSEYWKNTCPFARIIPISALTAFNLDILLNKILSLMPEHPPYYDKEELSDRPLRFFTAEIIREKIFLNYQKEVPYSCEVEIEEYRESDEIDRIRSIIYVERDSQKAILIGHKGSSLKKVGTDARKDMEAFLGKKVYLEIYVKVKENWRENEKQLKRWGY